MEDIAKTLKDIGVFDYALVTVGIWVTALGVVYTFGRMTGVVSSWKTKNWIATCVIISLSFYYTYTYRYLPGKFKNIHEFLYSWFLYFGISQVSYTLFAMRLWERVDKWLDRRVGEDNGESYKKTDRRTKK